jgi:hypothetical protein
MCLSSGFGDLLNTRRCISEPTSQWRRLAPQSVLGDRIRALPGQTPHQAYFNRLSQIAENLFKQTEPALMMKVKIVCAITMLAAVPAAAETKSPPIRQALVHEYARKQLPLARAAHAATYACHEVTSDCDFARDLRNTERCHNAERIVKHLGVIVRKELAKIKPPVTMDERNAIAEESIALAPSPIIKHGAAGEKDTCLTEWKD